MLQRILFCTAVILAIASVILLAIFSPIPHRKNTIKQQLALSLYIQHPQIDTPMSAPVAPSTTTGALIFHHTLTKGPENTSRVIGKAQGFTIPDEDFAHSAFNIIYFTFHTREYSGSIGIEAKNVRHKKKEELKVVGGTGSFAFARGHAVFAETNGERSDLEATYHIKLHLRFPNRSQIIPG